MTTGLVNMHIDRSIANLETDTVAAGALVARMNYVISVKFD